MDLWISFWFDPVCPCSVLTKKLGLLGGRRVGDQEYNVNTSVNRSNVILHEKANKKNKHKSRHRHVTKEALV